MGLLKHFNRIHLLFLVIALIAFAVRFVFLDQTIYNSDEAYLTVFALKMGHFFELPWSEVPMTGIRTSFGFRNPPFLIWLLTPVFMISSNPRVAMMFVMALGSVGCSLACYAVYRLLHLLQGGVSGSNKSTNHRSPEFYPGMGVLLAAVVLIFSPNAVHHTRQLWGHDLMLFFSSLCYLGAVLAYAEKRARWLLVSIAGAMMAQACHLSGIFLWIAPLMVFWRLPQRSSRVWAGAFFLVMGVLIYCPWMIHEAGLLQTENPDHVNFESFKVISGILTGVGEKSPVQTPVDPLFAWLGIFADSYRLDIMNPFYSEAFYLNPVRGMMMILLHAFSAMLVVGPVLMAAIWFVRRSRWKKSGKLNEANMLDYLLSVSGNVESGRSIFRDWLIVLLVASLLPMILFQVLPISSVPLYLLPSFVPALMLVCITSAVLLHGTFNSLRGIVEDPNLKSGKPRGNRSITLTVSAFLAGFLFLSLVYHLVVWVTVSKADYSVEVATTFATKQRVIAHINEVSQLPQNQNGYTVMQDGRTSEVGVDVWIAALNYALTGDRKSPVEPAAPVAFVVVDNKTILRAPLEVYLKDKSFVPIGTVRVYRFEGDSKVEWEALTTVFSSARTPG